MALQRDVDNIKVRGMASIMGEVEMTMKVQTGF
jgi:hypothetical protein